MDLRPYQREAVDAAYADLCSLPGNPIVDLPTGSGKSVVIAEIARRAVQQWSGHRSDQNYGDTRRTMVANHTASCGRRVAHGMGR